MKSTLASRRNDQTLHQTMNQTRNAWSSGSAPLPAACRRWLVGLVERRHFPPWFYHADERRWYVDVVRYGDEGDALRWLAKHPISPKDWLSLRLAMRR